MEEEEEEEEVEEAAERMEGTARFTGRQRPPQLHTLTAAAGSPRALVRAPLLLLPCVLCTFAHLALRAFSQSDKHFHF